MRIGLPSDPRVLAMADRLVADERFQEWAGLKRDMSRDIGVTTRVTVSVVVTGLLQIWGLVRQQGHAVERDMLVDHLTVETLSRLCGVPGFGQAMEAVGWVEALKPSTLRFPRSLDHMTSPEERKRQLATDRKRRQRERDRTRDGERDGHADVTHRGEKRREEESLKKGARAPLPPGRSRYSLEVCERYAASEPGINNPAAYARTIFQSGDDDKRIDNWMANGSNGASVGDQWRGHFEMLLRGYQGALTESDERLDLIRKAIDLIPRCASRGEFQGTLEELRESGLEL